MPFGKPIFEGVFDPDAGWTEVSSNAQSWTTVTYIPGTRPGDDSWAFRDPDAPFLRGLDQHTMASSDTRLAMNPEVIHDANGYYRLFGFSFPFLGITIRMMQRRYNDHIGQFGEHERMTYVLKLLRDPEVRRKYNLVPFWERYMDKYMEEWLKQKAMAEARRRAGASRLADPEVMDEFVKRVLGEWGYGLSQEPSDEDAEPLDDTKALPSGNPDESATVDPPWVWSYYTWRTNCDDTARLGRWQALLVAELTQADMILRFAVGYMGRQPQEWVTGEVQDRTVIYLNDEVEPTEEMATKVVSDLTSRKELPHGIRTRSS